MNEIIEFYDSFINRESYKTTHRENIIMFALAVHRHACNYCILRGKTYRRFNQCPKKKELEQTLRARIP